MTRITLTNINRAIAKHHVELVRGSGYFYFADLEGSPVYNADVVPSVYSAHLTCMPVSEWVSHVETHVREHYGDEVPYAY